MHQKTCIMLQEIFLCGNGKYHYTVDSFSVTDPHPSIICTTFLSQSKLISATLDRSPIYCKDNRETTPNSQTAIQSRVHTCGNSEQPADVMDREETRAPERTPRRTEKTQLHDHPGTGENMQTPTRKAARFKLRTCCEATMLTTAPSYCPNPHLRHTPVLDIFSPN